jgi:hypothetical protein
VILPVHNQGMLLWPIITLSIALMGYVTYTYITMERTTIMADWPNSRCGVFVMFASSYFKPDDDPRSPGEFGSDNMRFCMGELAKAAMGVALAPYNTLLTQQSLNLNDNFTALTYLRTVTKTMMDAFMSFLEPFFKKFTLVAYQVGAIVQHLRMAMGRVNAILTSFIYQGLSLVTGIQNMIQFIFIVIMIIIAIMIALLIILFIPLAPFIPFIILPAILVISVAGGTAIGAAASAKEAFCFEPLAPVVLASGATKPISEIQMGDVLAEGGTVEGILRMDGSTTNLYDLEGIRVSGSHLVNQNGTWHSVSDDSRAVPKHVKESVLYCLNTSNRLIPVRNDQGATVLFRDWEEIGEEDEVGQIAWESLVSKILGGVSEIQSQSQSQDTFCLMDGTNTVTTERGNKQLNEIILGDKLQLSYNRSTTVIGIVEGRVKGVGSRGWVSACIKKRGLSTEELTENKDSRPYRRISTLKEGSDFIFGRHLITDSGEFFVNVNGSVIRVRDFTEVGADLIHLTYPLVAKSLNK